MGYGINLIPFGSEKIGGNEGTFSVYGGFITAEVISDLVNHHISGMMAATM